MDNFTNIKFKRGNLDVYSIRKAILNALNENLSEFSGDLLDVGCGKMPYKQYVLDGSSVKKYIGLDIENALKYDNSIKPDFIWDGITMPFESNTFDCAIATEVLEHCSDPEIILKEVFRVLKPEGIFFFTVPFLWNLHEVPNDEYRYTPFSLERHLKNSGFRNTNIKATGGWHAAMAQMLGLWVKRSSMSKTKRTWLIYIIKPIMKYLLKLDTLTPVKFVNGQMITGLSGIVKK